jgi:hypothetical protein
MTPRKSWRPARSRVELLAATLAVFACSGTVACGQAARLGDPGPAPVPEPDEPDDPATAKGFQDLNGVMWFYTTDQDIRFADITRMMGDLHDRGIRVLGIFSPYDGNKEKFLGCAPRDFYATAPQSGTVEDFAALVDAAHARGMKVVAYFVDIYIDQDSQFFRTAEQQYAAGDRKSREVGAFHWADDPGGPLPTPAAGPSAWQFSSVANAYYWSLWEEPAFDYNLPGARAELERVEKFWLDTGLDGFMWDAAFVDPAFQEMMVDLPINYTSSDKWLTFESTAGEEGARYDAFGLTSWFNLEDDDTANDYTFVAAGEDGADDLEVGLEYADAARAAGKLTHAWTLWEEKGLAGYADEDRMRVQEAALLGGAGILFGHPNYAAYAAWPAARRAAWEQVLVAINRNRALLPSASRARVPAGPGAKAYAMLRVAKGDSQAALLVYNLGASAATVVVDLRDTGVLQGQTPVDMLAGSDPPPSIAGPSYSIDLPAHGFAFLEVEVD